MESNLYIQDYSSKPSHAFRNSYKHYILGCVRSFVLWKLFLPDSFRYVFCILTCEPSFFWMGFYFSQIHLSYLTYVLGILKQVCYLKGKDFLYFLKALVLQAFFSYNCWHIFVVPSVTLERAEVITIIVAAGIDQLTWDDSFLPCICYNSNSVNHFSEHKLTCIVGLVKGVARELQAPVLEAEAAYQGAHL